MAEYIEREKAIAEIDKGDLLVGDNAKWAKEILYRTPVADVVEVVKVAEILNKAFENDYPCNFCGIDEWLPYVCEYANTCDCSSVKCWEQLIKHYGERKCDK
jgi:hypothetical protein